MITRTKNVGRRGRPPRITTEQIIDSACKIGLGDLSLGSVAKSLNVTVAALYHYVRDRDQLAEFVADFVVAQYPLPPDTGCDWIEWANAFAHSQMEMFEAVPGLAQLAMQRTIPSALRRLEHSVRTAMDSGFDEMTAWWATRAIQEFVFSWISRQEIRAALTERTGESYPASLSRMISKLPPGATPHLKSIAEKFPVEPERERFEFTLRALLNGLSQERADKKR